MKARKKKKLTRAQMFEGYEMIIGQHGFCIVPKNRQRWRAIHNADGTTTYVAT